MYYKHIKNAICLNKNYAFLFYLIAKVFNNIFKIMGYSLQNIEINWFSSYTNYEVLKQ